MIFLREFVNWHEERTSQVWENCANYSVFEIMKRIREIVTTFITQGTPQLDDTFISPRAIVGPNVYIGNGCRIHDFACVRDHSILLDNVVVGHCSEIARSIVFSDTHITHKVTMSDSIVGRRVNIGACVTLASISLFNENIQNLNKTIKVKLLSGETYNTRLFKFGSVIGDNSRIGMNSSCAPGVLLGRYSIVYPNIFLRGEQYRDKTIIKLRQSLEVTSLEICDE